MRWGNECERIIHRESFSRLIRTEKVGKPKVRPNEASFFSFGEGEIFLLVFFCYSTLVFTKWMTGPHDHPTFVLERIYLN